MSPLSPRLLIAGLALLITSLACQTVSNILTPNADSATQTPPAADIQPSPAAAEPASPGKIAYIGTDGNIYVSDPDGENKTAITSDAGSPDSREVIYQLPTWSRRGQQLAFLGVHDLQAPQFTIRVWATDVSTPALVETFLSETALPIYLYWAPDNQSISILSQTLTGEPGLELYLGSVPAGQAELIDMGQPFYWAWSPDGTQILIHQGGDAVLNPNARVSTVDIAGQGEEQPFEIRPFGFQAPDWSPSGDRLLFAGENGTGSGILYVTDLTGSTLAELTGFDSNITFSWSPNGRQVAFIAANSPDGFLDGQLQVVDPDDLDVQVSTAERDVLAYFWAPNSAQIAFLIPSRSFTGVEAAPTGALDVMILDIASGESRLVQTFFPSASFIALLPFFDQYQRSATIWSPDSQHLVISAIVSDSSELIMVLDAIGDSPVKILDSGQIAFWSWD
jgi:Tol biopolymer transport system component